ncbi:unnamed protein product [Commensalibacter communis]|uniref:Uncharacterized protein n=1 Tax=Commensalibacter communis TaxID=2972786 RepID=A0A9W4TN39_9PROT|nr:hypothetical protein [Commensalibacter communis]CAI3927056.1 unnamed protein product [Commensalibacter communis]CAI3928573.1 unnamed protein product [Commensalibacter communis]CAI3933949.1 unnamed protein product [Commensalibacter communis]CAI3934439.1 unnamed protein product [Commensalibacter communis]
MSIRDLLEAYEKSVEQRKQEFIQEYLSYGFTEAEAKQDAKIKRTAGSIVREVPTFDLSISKKVSPQLHEHFLYTGKRKEIGETWLDVEGMLKLIHKPKFKKWVKSMRENWEDSAPMIYSDKQLSVISVASEKDGDFTLAVWNNPIEPEIWRYHGQSEQKFKEFSDWIKWLNGADSSFE